MALQLRPKHRTLTHPSLVRFFSASWDASAASPPPPDDSSRSSPQSQSSSASDSFSEIKARLRQPPPPPHQQQRQYDRFRRAASPFSGSSQPPPVSKVASPEEIRKNLSEFCRRSASPNPTDSNSSPPQAINLKGLLKRDVNPQGVEQSKEKARSVSHLSLEAIRKSLTNLKNSAGSQVGKAGKDPISLKSFQDTLRMKPYEGSSSFGMPVIGGPDNLPVSVFGKEMGEQKKKTTQGSGLAGSATRTEFFRMHTYEDLGEKLRKLRPETAGKGKVEFSLEELNERLAKLRENEEKETQEQKGGFPFQGLRETLASLRSESEKTKKSQIQSLDILGQMSQSQDYTMHPPKEHLLKQYFHPENMSSEEKMKIELAKVRDEFKMSESDCGSARVQVAQLTTKIKHLSSVLHKKDKHSRKGLEGMIQRRKKLLKYLRRTDWDSYCLVLSKLGLRDNPGLKLS